MTPDDIRKKIEFLLKEKGIPLNHASSVILKNSAYLHQFINKGSPVRLPEEQRKRLAQLLNVDEQDLTDLSLNQPILPTHMTGVGFVAEKISGAISSFLKKPQPDTVGIEMLNVSACCGAGIDNILENVVGLWQMPLIDFKSISLSSPEHIKIVKAIGDSMQPTISDGDFVFVDISNQSMGSDGIYVLSSETGLSIKRLQNDYNSKITISSDNQLYKSHTLPLGEIHILGRVVNIVNLKKI